MLVLNRKVNEEIRIGNNIVIKIAGVSDGSVKIGIEAPSNIPILRGELYSNVRDNVIEASQQTKVKPAADLKSMKVRKLNDEQRES